MVPNCVGTGRPPAKLAPPFTVWQLLQLPSAASSRPRLTRAGSNEPATGGSIAAIAGRQAIAKAAAAPAISTTATTLAIMRDPAVIPAVRLLRLSNAWASLAHI